MPIGAKLGFAWSLFFPSGPKVDHARDDAKKRLRMILVADRCALSPQALSDMKAAIVRAVADFVVVDTEEPVAVSLTTDSEAGAIFAVNIPVRRVKAPAEEEE